MTKNKSDPISPAGPDVNVGSIQNRIHPAAELNRPMSILLYGRSGTGKTTIAATFPKPLLFLDIKEFGTDSVCDIPGIDALYVETWQDFETIYWFLRAGNHQYKTIVIDTVTMMQKLAQEYSLEQDGKEKDGQMNKNLWGITSKTMCAWLINYRDLPYNIVFLAQDRITTEEGAREDQITPEVGPRLMPSVAACINAAVRIIGQTYIKEYTKNTQEKGLEKIFSYRLRLGANAYYLTKVRKIKEIAVPESIANPSYEKLMKLLKPAEPAEIKTEPKPIEKLRVVKPDAPA